MLPYNMYYQDPIRIQVFINLLMFIHISTILVKHIRDAKVLNGSDSARNKVNHEKQR